MSVNINDAGNVAIASGGSTGAAVSAAAWLQAINTYAAVIGLILTVVSIGIGIYFKFRAERIAREEREEEKQRNEAQNAAILEILNHVVLGDQDQQ
jgi:heme/copper-type cytochrome/quinol oxidase subunit 2